MSDSKMDNPYKGPVFARIVLTYTVKLENRKAGELAVDKLREYIGGSEGLASFEAELAEATETFVSDDFKVVDMKVEIAK